MIKIKPLRVLALSTTAAILSILWAPVAATAFQMRVSFCNKSASAVDVAVGYDLTGADETRSEGWFTVQPCACTTLFNEDVKTTDYWLYVTRNSGGVLDALTDGSGPLCVRAEKFTFRRSNTSRDACTKAGGTWVNFRRVAAQSKVHKMTFGSGGRCQD
jgi:uncharacterized membrane protein